MKRLLVVLVAAGAMMASAGTASAAAPDGPGPWADSVKDVQQGLRNDGTPVLPDRSDPTDALGVAENDPNTPGHNIDGSYFSLGFGGKLTLGFDNPICNAPGADFDVGIVEATGEPYPTETVNVYVSADGVSYAFAGTVARDGSVSLPASVPIARFVRLVDVSDPAIFPADADGYDVDGVRALNSLTCTSKGRMTGGGSLFVGKKRVTHGMGTLKCSGAGPTTLQVNWDKSKFHATALTSVLCFDDPAIDEKPPKAGFDTIVGTATGKYNGVAGATAEFTFTDAGEPGTRDTGRLVIRDKNGVVVLDVPTGFVSKGNHQAHAS